MKTRIDKLEYRVDSLEKTVTERGKNHDRNNEAFREIAIDFNKISVEKDVLQGKLNKLETEQAVQNTIVGQVLRRMDDIKEFMDKVVIELTTINTSINNAKTRDTTVVAVVKFLMQLMALGVTIGGSIIGVLKYLGKI